MKPRLKMDGFLLALVIMATLAVWSHPSLYTVGCCSRAAGNLLAFLVILVGAALRMTARGYKKAHSQNGAGLVKGGPYRYVRNPMYLGTFLIGAGFVATAWPWWGVPLFAVFFYLRFRKQIRIEEQYLGEIFGAEYAAYCAQVPGIFPSVGGLRRVNFRTDFPWDLAWTTNEARLMFILPPTAVAVNLVMDVAVFQEFSWGRTAVYALVWAGLALFLQCSRPRRRAV